MVYLTQSLVPLSKQWPKSTILNILKQNSAATYENLAKKAPIKDFPLSNKTLNFSSIIRLSGILSCKTPAVLYFHKKSYTHTNGQSNLHQLSASPFLNFNRLYSSMNGQSRLAFQHRHQLKTAKRIVVKLGSSVIKRPGGYGLALGNLATIVEQCAELQNEGREILMFTSGAVTLGNQKMTQELLMSLSMREILAVKDNVSEEIKGNLAKGASAAVGQSTLISLYEAMFSHYGVKVAQILITKPDFYNEEMRKNLISTINELLSLNILPIINTNDTVISPSQLEEENMSETYIRDNDDSLAVRLAVYIKTDLMIFLTDIDGIYNKPPKEEGSRLFKTFTPDMISELEYGEKSSVGTGGISNKVKSAIWGLSRGTSVVIGSGYLQGSIKEVINGRKIGTFFTNRNETCEDLEVLAKNARLGSEILQTLTPTERSGAIFILADLLEERLDIIFKANQKDLKEAKRTSLSEALTSRLAITPSKLDDLSKILRQIAVSSQTMIGRILRHTKLADKMYLKQVTVPIGVLLVILESRPECLPQIAALAMATGNGLLLKGGKEAMHTNIAFMQLVKQALSCVSASDAISLITSREDISDLLEMEGEIDLVIPRGSSELVRIIQEQSKSIPVLGHAEGICHVYVDKNADLNKAYRIVKDSKCDYPTACNAMETLLIHVDIFNTTSFFATMCKSFEREGVKVNAGPRLSNSLTFAPPLAQSFKREYSDLECTIELVSDLNEAIEHIHRYGSSHTDVIITEDDETAQSFLVSVDSACVFHNASSRFADGYRLGLGGEVSISTSRIHARGPIGMEGLLTTKWIVTADEGVAREFTYGIKAFLHETLVIDENDNYLYPRGRN